MCHAQDKLLIRSEFNMKRGTPQQAPLYVYGFIMSYTKPAKAIQQCYLHYLFTKSMINYNHEYENCLS